MPVGIIVTQKDDIKKGVVPGFTTPVGCPIL
jgi:hypothetical protein